jgi:hypothetical protein
MATPNLLACLTNGSGSGRRDLDLNEPARVSQIGPNYSLIKLDNSLIQPKFSLLNIGALLLVSDITLLNSDSYGILRKSALFGPLHDNGIDRVAVVVAEDGLLTLAEAGGLFEGLSDYRLPALRSLLRAFRSQSIRLESAKSGRFRLTDMGRFGCMRQHLACLTTN